MTARDRFMKALESMLGACVLMGAKGPSAYDCSGFFNTGIVLIGGPDLRATKNAQGIHDALRPLLPGELPLPGDGVFYGLSATQVEHVAAYRADGGVISADGATRAITSLAVALSRPTCRVRLHNTINYRKDLPYVALRRNTIVDALDAVER